MEMFVGRVTADAKVNTLKDERQVVNFSVAINDYYKAKSSSEGKKVVTFINCAYWVSPRVADRLAKGTLVEITGRLYVNAYKGMDGEARGSLNCHVSGIKVHSTAKPAVSEAAREQKTNDNLPF